MWVWQLKNVVVISAMGNVHASLRNHLEILRVNRVQAADQRTVFTEHLRYSTQLFELPSRKRFAAFSTAMEDYFYKYPPFFKD